MDIKQEDSYLLLTMTSKCRTNEDSTQNNNAIKENHIAGKECQPISLLRVTIRNHQLILFVLIDVSFRYKKLVNVIGIITLRANDSKCIIPIKFV